MADSRLPRQRGHSRYGNPTGPRFRGQGDWPHMTFDNVKDAGSREACELAQRLAALLLESMTAERISMRQLARDSEIDVTTVKSVLEGSYMPRLDTVTRLLVARRIRINRLLRSTVRGG